MIASDSWRWASLLQKQASGTHGQCDASADSKSTMLIIGGLTPIWITGEAK